MDTQASEQEVSTQNCQDLGKSPARKRVRSIRIPLKWLIGGGAVVGVVAGLSVSLASNYFSILIRQARDGYVVYRLAAERDELRATKQELERELDQLRSSYTQASTFEAAVKGRLAEINTIVETSTALGLLKKEKHKHSIPRGTLAAQVVEPSKEPNSNALAAILESPVLAKGKGPKSADISKEIEELRARNKGLGGAELECRKGPTGKVVCGASVSHEDVAFTDVRGALKPDFVASHPDSSPQVEYSREQQELMDRVALFAETLRTLPMGSPVAGEISSGFGYRVSPFSHRSSYHEGVDISLASGTKIRTTGDGVVVKAAYDGTYGWMIDVAHSSKVVTRYAHLTRSFVREGQSVKRGEVIALSGSTGRSTGPHLHYEVRVNGLAKNPMNFIALAGKLNKVLS